MKIRSIVLFSFILVLCFGINIYAQENQSQNKENETTSSNKADVPLKIIKTYRPKWNDSCTELSGKIALKITFHESGKVTKAEILEPSTCDYFNENAVRAALKTKFKPALKDSKPITVVRRMELAWGL